MENDEVLVLRCNAQIKAADLVTLRRGIQHQMDEGIVILPPYLEPMLVPTGIEIRIEEAQV